jgi:hypothetical protein
MGSPEEKLSPFSVVEITMSEVRPRLQRRVSRRVTRTDF